VDPGRAGGLRSGFFCRNLLEPYVKQLLAASIALSIASAALAAGAPSPKFDPKRLSADVKTLSSDAFEGRGPATPGEQKTIDYVVAQMKAAGVQPGGDLKDGKRAWTQDVPLVRTEISGEPKLAFDVAGKNQALRQGEDVAVRAAMDGSTSVSLKGAPLVFCGYGVKAPERHWDDFRGMDLDGKVMVVLVNDPDYETGTGDFGGKAMTYYGRWTYKYEEGARQHAAGVIVVHETGPASYGWATVKNSNTNTMFDIVRDHPESEHPQVEAWMQRDVAVDLFKRAGLDFEALKKQAQSRDFKPVVLKDATFSADFKVDRSVITSHNIVGRVEGSERPDETVVYTAHWDHLGVGAPDAKGDRIYNGAVDNAAGTAALIELARAFAHAPRPQRSVVFVNVTAEEKGLLGSEYYAANPVYPLAKTVADINMDGFDPMGPARNFTVSGNPQSQLLDKLVAAAKDAGLAYTPDPHTETGGFFRSDHFSFAKRGVPSLSFGSGNDLVDGGLAAGEKRRQDYIKNRYHQPADEWQADWSFAGMSHDLGVLYRVGSELANSGEWPQWSADSEFRAVREQTAAQRH
jgi:Zn-dependent M28 family amino/carboxypeptidase